MNNPENNPQYSFYFSLSKEDQKLLEQLEISIKNEKLKNLFICALENNDLSLIDQILNNSFDFYKDKDINKIAALNKAITHSIEGYSNSNAWAITTVENILSLDPIKYSKIHRRFIESIRFIFIENQDDPDFKENPQFQALTYITCEFLIRHPSYLSSVAEFSFPQIVEIKNKIEFSAKLEKEIPINSSQDKKIKL